jgi:hypothetical protein
MPDGSLRVVSLVPFNFNIGTIILQIKSERYIFANDNLFTNCTNGIPVAGILNNGSLHWTIMNVNINDLICKIMVPIVPNGTNVKIEWYQRNYSWSLNAASI